MFCHFVFSILQSVIFEILLYNVKMLAYKQTYVHEHGAAAKAYAVSLSVLIPP